MSSFNSFLPAAPAAPTSLVGGVPAVFTVSGVERSSSSFLPAVPSSVGAVVLSACEDLPGLVEVRGRNDVALRVRWACSDDPRLAGVLVALASGFAGGAGGTASGAFHAAVEAAVASGSPVFVGGAPGAVSGRVTAGFFCAVSSSPFDAAPADGAVSLRF